MNTTLARTTAVDIIKQTPSGFLTEKEFWEKLQDKNLYEKFSHVKSHLKTRLFGFETRAYSKLILKVNEFVYDFEKFPDLFEEALYQHFASKEISTENKIESLEKVWNCVELDENSKVVSFLGTDGVEFRFLKEKGINVRAYERMWGAKELFKRKYPNFRVYGTFCLASLKSFPATHIHLDYYSWSPWCFKTLKKLNNCESLKYIITNYSIEASRCSEPHGPNDQLSYLPNFELLEQFTYQNRKSTMQTTIFQRINQ